MTRILPLIFIGFVTLLFFWQFLLKGLFPIPADTIIGLYHPFRDLYARDYPNGIPFKNFLITDPVRQQYPWRELAVSIEKQLRLPLWNPYNFSGTPLLANFQSASLYPLNILFFFIPFNYAWSILVVLQPLLAGLFLYLYLYNIGLKKMASFLGGIIFSFSGFSIAWLEWNTVLHIVLWLPLVLLIKEHMLKKFSSKLIPVFIFAEVSQILAGHLQILFYALFVSNIYLLARIFQIEKVKGSQNLIKRIIFRYKPFLLIGIVVLIIASIQWIPALQFILQSARDVDQVNWQREDWFIPWQHLIQFIAPDFFGNPTTLNYWGVWNYGEFVGYIGILPLIMAFFALFFRHDRKTLFFGTLFFLSLLFSLPTFLAKIPYILNIPFFSTAQPTRILIITDFSLAVLSALGFDYFLKNKQRKIIYPLIFLGGVMVVLWLFVFTGNKILKEVTLLNLLVSKQNLYLPTILFVISTILILLSKLAAKSKFTMIIRIIIVGLVVFDLFRFGWKFTPFVQKSYLFPNTKTIEFLQKNIEHSRIMTIDSRILPPNFSTIYRLQSVDGYDPLYLRRYAELIAVSERGKPDISPPFGFNRIITPHNFDSKIIDLLGVKYILSLSDISSPKLKKVFQEGQTRVYENRNVMPRAFFVNDIKFISTKEEALKIMFNENFDFKQLALIEHQILLKQEKIKTMIPVVGKIKIMEYLENRVVINTESNRDAWLILIDSFYPTWHAKVDNTETKIYRTDYNFRGIPISKGKHTIEFYASLF